MQLKLYSDRFKREDQLAILNFLIQRKGHWYKLVDIKRLLDITTYYQSLFRYINKLDNILEIRKYGDFEFTEQLGFYGTGNPYFYRYNDELIRRLVLKQIVFSENKAEKIIQEKVINFLLDHPISSFDYATIAELTYPGKKQLFDSFLFNTPQAILVEIRISEDKKIQTFCLKLPDIKEKHD